MIKSISIILPLFNEAQRLNKTFDEIRNYNEVDDSEPASANGDKAKVTQNVKDVKTRRC